MDYMLTFIHFANEMGALFYDTVPAFEETRMECRPCSSCSLKGLADILPSLVISS
ncbi:hypothetical protein BKA66DRAFT_449545 [Pyrenochaeta sp. MPI-SDFR-AT-0127]|nr:hypothetical protein BKA66DRAFT_449545 [Pyrenochaeta sp. MPI-SDFR-AT-0127]